MLLRQKFFHFSLLFLLIASCSDSQDAVWQTNVLLEIVVDASELNYPPGERLYLRVLDDGTAEFDYYPSEFQVAATTRIKYEQLETGISREEIDEMNRLVSNLARAETEETYGPTQLPMDAKIKSRIKFRSQKETKEIRIEENGPLVYGAESPYPPELIELLKYSSGMHSRLLKSERERRGVDE